MSAAQENLRAALFAAHVIDIGANTVTVAECLARDQFVAADNRFTTAEIDDHIAVFDALDAAVDDFADTILVFVILAVTLGFTHLLHDNLLGGLGGNTAEIHRRQLIGKEIAGLRIRIAVARGIHADLRHRIFNIFDNFQQALQLDLAGLGVDIGADIGFLTVTRTRGFLKGIGHCRNDDLAVNRLLAGHRIGDLQKF
eukprot:gene28153-biopygen23903